MGKVVQDGVGEITPNQLTYQAIGPGTLLLLQPEYHLTHTELAEMERGGQAAGGSRYRKVVSLVVIRQSLVDK